MNTDISLYKATAICLIKAGRYEEANRIMSSIDPQDEYNELSYLFGISYLEQNKYDECIQELQKANGNMQEKIKPILIELLKRKAILSLNNRNWAEAGDALERAIEINSNDPQLESLMRSMPTFYLISDRREEAIRIWENNFKKDPCNYKILHSLTLAYHWKTKGMIGSRNIKRDMPFLKEALAYWATLFSNESFWFNWVKERLSDCGFEVKIIHSKGIEGLEFVSDINNENISRRSRKELESIIRKVADNVKKSIEDDIRKSLRTNMENSNEFRANYEQLLSGLTQEMKVIKLLRQAKEQEDAPEGILSLPDLGPLLLAKFGLLENARLMFAHPHGNKRHDLLRIYLFDNGIIMALIDEKKYKTAMNIARLRITGSSSDIKSLFAIACSEYVDECSKREDFEEAIKAVAEANKNNCMKVIPTFYDEVDLYNQLEDITSEIVKKYDDMVKETHHDANGRAEAKRILKEGVSLLNQAHTISKSIANSLVTLTMELANYCDDFDEAIGYIKQVYDPAPDNIIVKQKYSELLYGRGIEKWNPEINAQYPNYGNIRSALNDLVQAIDLDPDGSKIKSQGEFVYGECKELPRFIFELRNSEEYQRLGKVLGK